MIVAATNRTAVRNIRFSRLNTIAAMPAIKTTLTPLTRRPRFHDVLGSVNRNIRAQTMSTAPSIRNAAPRTMPDTGDI